MKKDKQCEQLLRNMRSSTINKLFIFYISKFSISSITHACITLKWDLYVVNTIFDDIVTLIKSKDDYIGNHTLQLNINYHWSFCERICMLRVCAWHPRSTYSCTPWVHGWYALCMAHPKPNMKKNATTSRANS